METFSNWLARSGQTWKIAIFGLLCIFCLGLFIVLVASYRTTEVLEFEFSKEWIGLIFVIVGIVAFTWFGSVFRCPVCRANLGKHVLTSSNATTWFVDLLQLKKCPYCHNDL